VTDAELAILSLVVEEPRHGYDIERTIAERNMRDWTDVGFSSIYYLLGKLETAGLVTSRRVSGRGPARRVYSATDGGVATLRAQALRAIAGPAHRASRFQVGLSVLPWLGDEEAAAAIADHERGLAAQLETLRQRGAGEPPFHVAAMFDLAMTQVAAELDWIRRFAVDFQRHRSTERTP
jgi:DNA-binding PadR family transcriptional regulator